MASIINASSSGSGGIVQTADASGVLQLQTASTAALTINTSQQVGIGTTNIGKPLVIQLPSGGDKQIQLIQDSTNSNGGIQWVNSAATVENATLTVDSSKNMIFGLNSANRMQIDSSGRVTMPYQPSFFVFLNASTAVGSGGQKVNFDSVRQNIGSGWNSTTKRFTAPVAGSYQFNLVISYDTCPSGSEIQLWKNGSSIAGRYDQETGTCGEAISVTVLLAANDYMEVYSYSGSGRTYTGRSDAWTSFSGYLIG